MCKADLKYPLKNKWLNWEHTCDSRDCFQLDWKQIDCQGKQQPKRNQYCLIEYGISTSEHSYYSGTTPKLFNIERTRKTCDPSSKERIMRGTQSQNIPDIGRSKDLKADIITMCSAIKGNALKMKKIYTWEISANGKLKYEWNKNFRADKYNICNKMFIGLLIKYK